MNYTVDDMKVRLLDAAQFVIEASESGYRAGIAAAVEYLRQHSERIETGEITVLQAAREIERMGEE